MACDQKIEEYMDFAMPLVLESGKALLQIPEDSIQIENKQEKIWDVVTIYDRKIEELLIKTLKRQYPNHKFIGEEESSAKDRIAKLTEDPTWIIDPIDGTANFVKQMPLTCISVGLVINKEQVMGIVFNPYMNELFTAVKGKGAFFNGKRIFTSGTKDIQKCIFNYELSIARTNENHYYMYMYRLKHLIKQVMGVRSFGCAVLGLCYVACGRLDAYQCDGLFPWDAAAGTLIVKEAGGCVMDTTGTGKDFDLMDPNYLAAASKELADTMLEIEKKADDEQANSLGCKNGFKP